MLLLKEIILGVTHQYPQGYPQTHPNGAPHFLRVFIRQGLQ